MLVFRFTDRFGKGIRGAPRDALIAESTPHKDLGSSFGFHRGMDTLGAVIGPATAFILLSLFTGNCWLVFWFPMMPGIIAVLIIVFFVREQNSKRAEVQKSDAPRLLAPGESPRRLVFCAEIDWRFKTFVAILQRYLQ